MCCAARKVAPLREALAGLDAWVTGIRRDQTADRAGARVVEWDARFGLVKVNPLATWSPTAIKEYAARHRLPEHPLVAKGYLSIGCAPCTRAVRPGESERAGRWWWEEDETKECGLHVGEDGVPRRPPARQATTR